MLTRKLIYYSTNSCMTALDATKKKNCNSGIKLGDSSLNIFCISFKLPHITYSGSVLSSVAQYLRIATVRASGELAQGQMTSCLRPLLWKTLRNASQEEIDPGVRKEKLEEKNNLISEVTLFKLKTYY